MHSSFEMERLKWCPAGPASRGNTLAALLSLREAIVIPEIADPTLLDKGIEGQGESGGFFGVTIVEPAHCR
ncbi:MAG: hypothetical protein AB1898_18010 [Acidobacteriota bacterium]